MAEERRKSVQELISAKAGELFDICDKERKGFIIKRDIQHLRDELALEPDQLEEVFDSLDIDHNGFLTLEEFSAGFEMYLGNQMTRSETLPSALLENERKDQEAEFHQTLASIGAKGIFDDEEIVRGLWMKLRENDPILLRQFEEFLRQTTEEMKRSKSEHRHYEVTMQMKSSLYDEEMKRLYEEMEQQLTFEKATLIEQEKAKERELREQMEKELQVKEQELTQVTTKQTDLEMRVMQMNLNESETRSENERLLKEKVQLEQELQEISRSLHESKNYISQLQMQTKKEKRDRAKQTLNLTENLAIEHETLVKELNQLKSINKQLLDERDLHPNTQRDDEFSALQTQGSVLSNYFGSPLNDDSEPEEDDSGLELSQRNSSIGELGVRHPPVGAHAELLNVAASSVPHRLFKVTFIGDSGVGKTSFVQRFCTDTFKESFASTIGVDLQIKMLNLNGEIIALQLWDTAGQERFRSLTKQFFRRSDGIVLVYDVTSEMSFRSIRGWMSSIQELVDDDCVIALVGNKIDLCVDGEARRPVKHADGARLAEEHGCLFFESSTRLGVAIVEPMEAMARLMQEKGDRLRSNVTSIDTSSTEKNRSCCS